MTKEERLSAMDWSHPDWELLYHCLLYEVHPHNFVDKRTHQQAHEETMHESRFLRRAMDELYTRVGQNQGKDVVLDLIRTMRAEVKDSN